jgi:hypothetical protein
MIETGHDGRPCHDNYRHEQAVDLDVLVEADPDNAKRVYAALAAFGAPLSAFEVNVEPVTSMRRLSSTSLKETHAPAGYQRFSERCQAPDSAYLKWRCREQKHLS